MRGRSRGHQHGKQVPSFVPPASSISPPLVVTSASSNVPRGSPAVPRLRVVAVSSNTSALRLSLVLHLWSVSCSIVSLFTSFFSYFSCEHSTTSPEGIRTSQHPQNGEGRPSPQSASLSTLSSGTGALGDTTNGGSRFFGQRLAFLWEWLEGLRQCAEALWDLFVVIALSLWRVLSLQFCPRRREYLVHAQGIAAIARLALERERDDDRGLGLDYDSGPISYTTSLIDNTFFPPLPGFGPTPNSPAAVSPFSTHPSAGFWACLSSLWPDVDPEDYSGSAVVRLAAVLSVWADSFRQLGTLLQLSADLEPRGWAKRNLFFGARENLAVSAVEAFGDRAIPKSTPQKSSNGRLLRNSEAEGVFSRLLSWFSCLWPLWKRGEKGGVGKGTCQPGSAAGLFPYLLWWRWWPAAAAAAIPRNPGKNGVITYSSPCFFPGVGRCVDAGCGPTPSNLEDYWSYARILTAADHSTRESLDGRGSESACVLSPFEFGDIMSQPAPRPVFPPLFFSSDLFPSVFGGWLFPVTGNPSFATLPFFRVLWWPAAVAAAGGGYSSPWRLHPGGVALTARCETTSQRQRCSLHAQGGAYCSSRISSSSSSKHSSFRIEEDGRGAKLWQTAWRNGCSGGDDEDGHCFSSQLRCLDFSLSSLAGGPPPIFCVNSMKEGVSSSSLPHCQESGNRKNMPSEHKAAPVVTRRGDESDSFITRLLSKLCPGVSRLLVEPCRFCALNLRADIKPPPPSFVAPPPAFMPQCVTRTMEFLCCPGKSGEEKCSRDDSSQSSNSSSPPHKNRNRHATSGGSSSVVGPHILLPETSSGRGGNEANGFFYYASPTRRCTCAVLLPQRGGVSVAVNRLSSDGFFVPVSTVRTRSQHGSNPAVGGSHNARKQCRGGGGNSNNGQKGSGSSVHAPSGVSGASEAAAKIALEQKHRLSHLPVHLHAAHCILGLTGVPATAAAVDEAYCRQLVLVGDPPAVTQGGGSNLCSGTKCKTAPAPHDGINSGVTNSREEADSDVPRGMEEGVSRIRGSSLTEKRGGQEEGCPFGEKVNCFSSLLEGLPVSPTMSKSPFRHEDDSLLSGSFGSVVRGSWRREYVFKRVVGDIVEGSSLTGGSSYTPSSDGGGKPSWGSGTQQLALPRYEDFCDLLGVLHRARTAAQLFLALNRYPGAAGSVTHPASSSISSATANPTTSVTSEVVGAKAKTLEGGIRNHVSSEGGCPDLWSSCLFVPGPSPFSFAINKRSGGGKAGAEVTSFRGQETVVEEVEGGSSPGSSTGSSEERGSRSSMPAAVLQLSGAAVTSTYLQRRREDAQLIVQAFLVAFVFTRMRLQAAIGKFVTRKEGLCTSKQANQLQEMFRLSSDWIRTGGGGGKLATSLLTAQEDRSKYTCLGPPAELPRCLEYEFSAHPVAVAVREKLFLLLRLLLLDSSPAGVFERWKGRTHQGEELDSEPVEDVRKTRFDMLRQPWMFDRGYSILADLGNGSTVLHFAARFGCIEALSIVSFEVAPTTWWKCMLKKNNDGDLPVDVALRWHPIGGEVAEAFADASKRAKEVEAYRLYLNKRKCGFGAFAKAIFFALFAAFVPTSILSIPFFFTFFGEGVADTFALRVSVALLLFIGEFIVRQTGLGERCFSFYAGLAVGAGFSLVQIFSDLTHDILIEGIYMESAVRVCLLVLFFHYAATPSSVSRIGDCITEVFVVLWRSLRRVGRACGLGRLLSPLRGWSRLFLEASPQPPAAPEVLGQYSCHLTVHQHNRGSGFGQHSGGGGVTSSRGSSLSAISPSGHGDVRGGGSGAASRPGSSANQVFSSTTSSVSGGGEGRHPREDSRNISSVGGSKHEPRGRKVGSKKDLSKLTSWLSISMRPFGHLASRTKSFLIMLSAAIQHCFDIRYTIRVIATAFLLMGLTSSMIAGWWLVTDDFTYAVFSWSSTPTGEDSLSSSYYQHRHPDPRVVQTPPGPVPRQRGTGPEGYSFHSRPAAGLPPHRVPNSVLENGSVHTFVGGTGGGYLRSYPDRSAQISEVRVHDAAATQNMWSAPGLPGTSETGKDDTYRHFPPSLGFSVLGHHDWDDGDIFTSLPSSALELCQAGPLESTAVAYNLSFKEAVAETFSGSEGSGAQVGGASGLSSAVAESVLMMLSRSPVISESLKETFRHHSFDNGTYGEVCRVWRSTKLREAYKLLDVHFPMAGDQQVVEDAVDVTERDEDRAKEAPHQGSGNAAQSARAPAGPEESSDGGEVTPRDSEDSAGARDPWREEGGEQSEKGEVEGKAGAPSLFSGVSEKEGRSLPEAKKGTNGTAPEPLSPSSYSTVFHTNTRPSSDSSQSDRLHHRACPRGRCRAQRVSANSFGHGFARQQAEDEQERELCRWTSHRVGTRGETELEWTGDADGGTAVPSLQLMAYCIKRLENGLRKKAGLPQVDDERFYEAVRSRLVEALLQLDISAVSEEDFVSILFPLICMGCTEFDDVTGACIGHDREAQRRRQQQAMHCARRVHAWHLQRVITGVNEEDQGENSRLEGGCTTTDVEAASERNSPSGRTVKANFEIATGYNYFQLYRPLRGFWSRVRQNSSASSAGREENRKMAQRVERAAALLWPLGSPAARRVLGLSASVSGAGAPSPAGAEGSEASSGFRSGDRSIQGLRSDVATGECSKRYSIHMEGAPSPYPVDKKPSEASTGAAVAALCSFMDQTDTVDTEPEPCPECAQQILRLQQLREGMRCYRQLLLRVLARRRRTGYSTPPPASTSVGLGGAESLRSAVGVEGEEGKNLQEGREESRTDNSFTSRELHDDRVSGQGDPQVEQGGNAPFTRADSIFGSRGVEGLEEKPEEALLQGLLSIQRGGLLRSVKRILFYGTLRQNERIKQGHGTTADQRGGEGASGRRGNDTVGGARSPTDRKQANTSRRSCQNYHSDSWSANQAGGTAAKSSKKAGGSSQHIGHRDNGPGALPGGKLPHNQKEGVKRYRWYTVLIGIVLGIAGSAVAWLVYQCWVEHCAEWYSQQLQQEESNLSLRLNEPNKKGHPTGVKGGGNKCAGKKSAAVPSVGQHPRKPQNAHQNSSSLPTPVSSPIAVCSAPSSPAGPPGASVAASATALSRPTASAGEHGLFVCSANASHAASGIVTAAKEKLNAANLGCRGGGAGTGKTQSEPPELKGEEEKADSGAGVGVAPQLGGDKQALPDLRQPEEREEGSRGATERGAAHGRLGVKKDRRDTSAHTSETTVIDNGEDATDALRNSLKSSDTKLVANLASARKRDKEEECEGRTGKSEDRLTHTFGDEWSESGRHGEEGKRLTGARVSTALRSGSSLEGEGSSKEAQTGPPLRVEIGTNRRAVDAPAAEGDDKEESLSLAGAASAEEEWEFVVSGKPKRQHEKKTSVSSPTAAVSTAQASRRSSLVAMQSAPAGASKKPTPTSAQRSGEKGTPMEMTKVQQGRPYQTTRRLTKPQHPVLLDKAGHVRTGPLRKQAEHFLGSYRSSSNNFTQPGTEPGKDRVPGCASVPASDAALGKGGKSAWTVCADHRAKYSASGHAHSQVAVRGAHPLKSSLDEGINPKWEGGEERPGSSRGGGYGGTQTSGRDRGVVLSPRSLDDSQQVEQLQKLLAALRALNASYDLAKCQLPHWALDCLDEEDALQLRDKHGWRIVPRHKEKGDKQNSGLFSDDGHVLSVPKHIVQRLLEHQGRAVEAQRRAAAAVGEAGREETATGTGYGDGRGLGDGFSGVLETQFFKGVCKGLSSSQTEEEGKGDPNRGGGLLETSKGSPLSRSASSSSQGQGTVTSSPSQTLSAAVGARVDGYGDKERKNEAVPLPYTPEGDSRRGTGASVLSTSGGGGGSQASRSSSVCGQRRARTRSSAGASLGSVENSTKGQGNETKLSGEHRDTLDHQQSQGQDMVLEACASILSAKPDFLSRSLSSEAQTCLPAVEAERDNRKYARASFESNLKGSTVDGIVGVSRGFAGGTLVAPGTDNGHEYQLHQVTALNLVADTGFAKPNREVTGSSSIWMERAGNHFCEDSVAKVAAGSHAGSSIPPSLARLFLHPSPRLAPENDEAAPCGGRKTTVFDSIGPPPGLGAVSENQQFSPSSAPASSFLSRSGSYPCAIQSQEQDASGAIRPSQPLSIFPPRTDGSCRPRGDSVYSDFFSKGGGGDQSGDVSPSQEIRTEERPLFPLAAKIPMPSDAARVSSSFLPDDLKPAHELLAAALLQRPQNTADGGEQGWLPFASSNSLSSAAFGASSAGIGGLSFVGSGTTSAVGTNSVPSELIAPPGFPFKKSSQHKPEQAQRCSVSPRRRKQASEFYVCEREREANGNLSSASLRAIEKPREVYFAPQFRQNEPGMISSSPGGGHSLSESQDLRWRQFLGAGGGDDTVAEVAGAPAVGGGRVEMAAPSRSSFPSSSLEGSNSGLSYASRGGGRETTGGCQESAFAGTAREDRLECSDGEGRRSGEDEWKEMLTYLGERLDVSKLHSAEWGTSRGGGLGWRGSSDEVFSDVSFQKTGGNYAESSQGTAPGRRSLEMTSNRPGPEGQGTGAFGMSSCPSSNSVLSHRILKEGVFRKSADAFDTYKCVGGGPGGAGGRSGFANSASGDLFGSSSFRASQERLSPVTRTPSDHARSVPWCVQASSSEGLLLRAGDEPTRSFGTEELAAGDLEASLMTVAATRSGQRLVYVGGERTVEELRMTSLSPRREQLLLRLGSEGLAGGHRSSLGSAHCQEGGRGLHGLLCERTAATERERLLPLLRPAARREQEERTDAVKAPFPELTWTDRILGGAREDQTTEG